MGRKAQDDPPSTADFVDEGICFVLGNSVRIAQIARNYLWNTRADTHPAAHKFFKRQTEDLNASADQLAAHVVRRGATTLFDFTDITVDGNPAIGSGDNEIAQMIANLSLAHEQAIMSVDSALEVAREFNDADTIDILEDRLQAHRGYLAYLRSQTDWTTP